MFKVFNKQEVKFIPRISRAGVSVFFLILGLSGCSSHRVQYDLPVVPLPERFTKAPTQAELVKSAAEQGIGKLVPLALSGMLAQWWLQLESPELNAIVTRALANSPDLQIASARIAQSHARLAQAGADEVPTVTMPYQAKTFFPEGGVGSVKEGGKLVSRNTYQLSLQGSWRADIWGEREAMYESAELQMWRATFQRDDVQRTLIVSIVNAYAEMLSLNDRLRVARESDVVLGEMLASVELRMEKGDATTIEVEQQRAAVHSVRATVPVLEQQRVVLLNRLASLAGTVPGELNISEGGLDSIKFPPVLPGVPSALLLRRPDVRVTEARLLAASADINVARARLLPPLDLTVEAGYGSLFFARLIQPANVFGSLVANLATTLFDRGKREKEVAFNEAVRTEMVQTYIKVIYDAVREVDDSLSAIRLMGRRLDSQQMAVNAARRAWNSSIESYSAAGVDYLVVLDTERSYHRNLDDWYSARLDRYKGLIALFGALGGGVPMAGELPGDGTRPTALPNESDYGLVMKSPTGLSFSTSLGAAGKSTSSEATSLSASTVPSLGRPLDDSFEELKTDMALGQAPTDRSSNSGLEVTGEEFWLVEMAGLHDRLALTTVWYDLRRRFASLVENQTMLPRRQERPKNSDSPEGDNTPWYRLFIARYANAKDAEEMCAALKAGQFNCRPVSSRLLKHIDVNVRMGAPAPATAPARGDK